MKKTIDAMVVSSKMQKTAIVEVSRKTPHPLYKKLIKRSKKYKVDIGEHTVSKGDVVRIEETPPMSKSKYFKIIKVLERVKE